MGVYDVSRLALREQKPDRSGVGAIQWDKSSVCLSRETSEAHLARWIARRLGQCGCRNCDADASLSGTGQDGDDAPVVAVETNQTAGVESNAAQAAFLFLPCFLGSRMASAQARSFLVRGPAVCWRASLNVSRQPAASESAIEMACFTNAEVFEAWPDSTKARIWATCSVGTVMVILVVAISITISARLSEEMLLSTKR